MSLSYRGACKRRHRTIGNFLAMKAWCSGADCVILDRSVVDSLLDLKRIKSKRTEWLTADIKEWFPYIDVVTYVGNNSVASLILARVPVKGFMGSGVQTDRQRVENLEEYGIKSILLSDPSELPRTESGMLSQLTKLATGMRAPTAAEPIEN